MREIKFRAWDKAEKRWYQNAPVIQQLHTDHTWTLYSHLETVEIMQYTGLKNKNGKEIYEGDIIPITVEFLDKSFQPERVREWVKMPSGDIVVRLKDGESLWFNSEGQHPKSKLVIGNILGNIYENPELLAYSQRSKSNGS